MTNLNVEKQFALEHFAEWLPEMLRYILHAEDERIVYEAGETVAHVAFMLHPELRVSQPKIVTEFVYPPIPVICEERL